jgi:hypothetical protein
MSFFNSGIVNETVLHQAVIAQSVWLGAEWPGFDSHHGKDISPPPPPVCPDQLWSLQSFLSKLQAARARNHGLIPGRSTRLFSSPKCPAWLSGPPSLIFNGHQGPLSLGVKWQGHEVGHSLLCSAKVKEEELYCHSPCTFMVCAGVTLSLLGLKWWEPRWRICWDIPPLPPT